MKHNAPSAAIAALLVTFAIAACSTSPQVQESTAPPPPPPSTSFVEKLDADGLFAFGKAGIRDISPDGRAALDALAARLADGRTIEIVHVIGHSDRIGSRAGNLRLSNQRAEAVRGYLVEHGVPSSLITAVGRGDVEPVVECTGERGDALIACLAPNRRVEVRVRFAN